jgi:ABC-type Fe3+-hydroxamate transport system substrate-binding protein
MTRDDANRDGSSKRALTRRDTVRYGAAALGGGLVAGCTSVGGDSEETPESTPGESDNTDDGYTVSISPVGDVRFESPPETVFTRLTHHADMAFALGRGDGITALHAPDYYDGLWNQFVERLPGVSLDWSGLYSSWEPDKETLYELDSDVHLADPAWVTQHDSWSRSDIQEVEDNIGPWFGNSLSDRHQEPPEWVSDYEYYGLWEQFELVAEAFRERERYRELAAIHDELLADIEAGLPSDADRPRTIMIAAMDLETIYAYTLSNPGFLTSHTRPLKPKDAFEGEVESGSIVGSETLLEADPEVILFLGGFEPSTDLSQMRENLESDSVTGEIDAVKNDRVYPQGARYQGPVLNLFQLEMTAKQLYPEAFGEWPDYVEGPYPEISEDEQLFDRQRVADVINGEF